MKKAKKFMSILLVLTMVLSLAGCGGKSAADSMDEVADSSTDTTPASNDANSTGRFRD